MYGASGDFIWRVARERSDRQEGKAKEREGRTPSMLWTSNEREASYAKQTVTSLTSLPASVTPRDEYYQDHGSSIAGRRQGRTEVARISVLISESGDFVPDDRMRGAARQSWSATGSGAETRCRRRHEWGLRLDTARHIRSPFTSQAVAGPVSLPVGADRGPYDVHV